MARTKTATPALRVAKQFLTAQEITRDVRFNRIELYRPDDPEGVHNIAPAIGWWIGWTYYSYPEGWKAVEDHMLSGWRALSCAGQD